MCSLYQKIRIWLYIHLSAWKHPYTIFCYIWKHPYTSRYVCYQGKHNASIKWRDNPKHQSNVGTRLSIYSRQLSCLWLSYSHTGSEQCPGFLCWHAHQKHSISTLNCLQGCPSEKLSGSSGLMTGCCSEWVEQYK